MKWKLEILINFWKSIRLTRLRFRAVKNLSIKKSPPEGGDFLKALKMT